MGKTVEVFFKHNGSCNHDNAMSFESIEASYIWEIDKQRKKCRISMNYLKKKNKTWIVSVYHPK